MTLSILLVDDEKLSLKTAKMILQASGYTDVVAESDSRKVEELLERKRFHVVALDISMPYVDGRALLGIIRARYPKTIVIMITANQQIESAVACMREGAYDYLVKPITQDRLLAAIRRAIEKSSMIEQVESLKRRILRDELENPEAFSHIVTQNKRMKAIFSYCEAIRDTSFPVLLTGETGTGKELMAKALHNLKHPDKPFVAVNLAGLDDAMFSDTLFGHSEGAFTGAAGRRKGLIETAADGTLFLDEIGDLRMESQVKLLRLVQEGEYFAVGSDIPKRSNAWVVVATNADISNAQRFRQDLYYRLQTHHVNLPPLRERSDDIPSLSHFFIDEACSKMGIEPIDTPNELTRIMMSYSFPGNIRELKGAVYDLVGSSNDGSLELDKLRQRFSTDIPSEQNSEMDAWISFGDRLPTLKELETRLMREALSRADGNKTAAAAMIGVTRQTLVNRLK